MRKIIIAGLILMGCQIGLAQSKKEMKVKLMVLQAQVDQLKENTQKLTTANSRLQQQLDSCGGDQTVRNHKSSDTLTTEVQRLKNKILKLQEELYQTRLTQAEEQLPANLKQPEHKVKSPSERDNLAEFHSRRYLSNCIRFNNPQRMFSEEILLDFEVNPINQDFSGFLRKRYIPEMGTDQYAFHRVEGKYRSEKDFYELKIHRIGDREVDILVKCGKDRDLYNEVLGDPSDLTAFHTIHGDISQFTVETCRQLQ